MKVTVLGVPSSAGAYCVGVERAPAALRAAGLVVALRTAGAEVVDAGDLTTRMWRPDRESPFAQNLGDEADAVVELSAAAADLLTGGERLLVLGGSCTVAVGMCAAMAHSGERPRIVYVDRHMDLNTPRSTTESLSWMGMAHALALEGAAPELAGVTGRVPLLHPSDLVYLGVDPTRETTDWEREQAADLGLAVVDQAALCDDPRGAARDARGALTPGPRVGRSQRATEARVGARAGADPRVARGQRYRATAREQPIDHLRPAATARGFCVSRDRPCK